MLWAFLRKRGPDTADPEAFFTDPHNRIDIPLFEDFLTQAKRATSDDMVAYKAALAGPAKGGARPFLMRYFSLGFGLKRVFRKTLEHNRIPGGGQADIVSASKTHAVIRLHWPRNRSLPADFCLLMKGTLQAVPTRFALGLARLWERTCFFKGDSCCEYEMWWDKQAIKRPVVLGAIPAESGRKVVEWPTQKPGDCRDPSGGPRPRPAADTRAEPAQRVGTENAGAPARTNRGARSGGEQGPKPTPRRPERHGPQDTRVEKRSTTVLLADHPMLIDVDRQMLQALGYRVRVAGSGREALEVYDQHRDEINLAIVDTGMPDMDGPTLCGRLRAINPEIRVLFLSAGSAHDRMPMNMTKDRDGVIAKPFSLECLSAAIGRLLKGNGHNG